MKKIVISFVMFVLALSLTEIIFSDIPSAITDPSAIRYTYYTVGFAVAYFISSYLNQEREE